MGLDMYLEAELYAGGWEHSSKAERQKHDAILKAAQLPPACSGCPSVSVSVNVAYWRKANHIHNWFVQNVQGGEDECQRSYVSRDQLGVLLNVCQQVLDTVECVEGDVKTGTTYHANGEVEHHTTRGPVVAQQGIAQNLLPTAKGFFFGCTDYDEFYLADLRETVEALESILQNHTLEGCTFYYHASW